MAGENGFNVRIDTTEWNRFAADAKNFDPALLRSLRKRIRGVGTTAVQKVKETLALPSPSGGSAGGTGGRADLISGTRLGLSFSARSAGVKITTVSKKSAWAATYNKADFRHPVFGNDNAWVEQKGRPYFGKVIQPVVNKEMLIEIRAAFDDAVKAMGGSVR